MNFTVVIPARYASTRFPGKPLAMINNKPMIQHVYERALASGSQKVIIATDDKRILDCALGFNAEVRMTSDKHENGTARISEVVTQCDFDTDEIVINVQGDEPFIPPQNIRQLAKILDDNPTIPMSTLCHPIDLEEDVFNANIVKVVMDTANNALYFSRSPIPFAREFIEKQKLKVSIEKLPFKYYRHIGIYGYRAHFVTTYSKLQASPLSMHESLEQLRVLEHGYNIIVQPSAVAPPHGVDTPEDLAKLTVAQQN